MGMFPGDTIRNKAMKVNAGTVTHLMGNTPYEQQHLKQDTTTTHYPSEAKPT